MKSIKLVMYVFVLMTVLSFKNKAQLTIKAVAGTYGVCSYQSEGKAMLSLVLNEDQTFHFIDKTNAKKPIDVKGSWDLQNNTIQLKGYTSENKIHHQWKIDANQKCIKARKGLTFYRLCNVKECK
jgi:hypothetical protein